MGQIRNTFRLFVSSTFSDLKLERNALHEKVFPRLRELCEQQGTRFQAIDLRWGVSSEASLDQQTMNICLGEIERCQEITPRPNFLVLLGDRYGWYPPPPQIPAIDFIQILERLAKEDQELINEWYRKDENAIPPEYVLQPRLRGSQYEDQAVWQPIEARLQSILAQAAEGMELNQQDRMKYTASATHQEIAKGAMQVADAQEHVLCFFRRIEDLPLDSSAAGFLDLDGHGLQDRDASVRLEQLKEELRARLSENVYEFNAKWDNGAITIDHLDLFCQEVYERLSKLILTETARLEDLDALDQEITEHETFGKNRARFFTGRAGILKKIADYLESSACCPLVISGISGSGKTAVIARAVEQASTMSNNAEIIYRFIGATPDSSSGRELLQKLCLHLSRVYGADPSTIPSDYLELVREFPERLSLATKEKPLILFLDALDQLSSEHNARSLTWLPPELPKNVRLVVSTIPGETEDVLRTKVPQDFHLEILPMPKGEGEDLLDLWLEDAKRTLQEEQRQEILTKFVNSPQPLYLKLAFEEARRWKSYEGIPKRTDGQKGLSDNIEGVLRDLLTRLSSEAMHGECLVSRSLGYLASGKNGLAEDELIDVLAKDLDVYTWFLRSLYHTPPDLLQNVRDYLEEHPDFLEMNLAGKRVSESTAEAWLTEIRQDPDTSRLRDFLTDLLDRRVELRLPVVLWSRLYFDLEPYLAHRTADGASLLGFYHRQVSEVVSKDYLDDDSKRILHQSLARYFKEQSLWMKRDKERVPNLRLMSELPYQQAHAKLLDELQATLTDFPFLQAKLAAVGPQPLIVDYDEAYRCGYQSKSLSILQNAIRLSANVLAKDRGQFAGQMIGRLLERSEPEIQSFLTQAKQWDEEIWLCPLTSNLLPSDASLMRTLDGHSAAVTGVAGLSEKGQVIISASEDHTLRVWDVRTGDELYFLEGHEAPVWAVAMFPDGKRAVSGAKDHSVLIWDLDSRKILRRLEGHSGAIHAISVCPEGLRVISASDDQKLILWDVETGRILSTLDGHDGTVNAVAVSKDGNRAISASSDLTLRLWNLNTGKTLHVLQGHTSLVKTVAFLEDGRSAISGAYDPFHFKRNLKVWDLETGEELQTLKDRTWGINDLVVMPDGLRIIAAVADGTIKLWNLESGQVTRTLEGHSADVKSLMLSSDGQLLVSASNDGTLKVWDLEVSQSIDHLLDSSLPIDHRLLQERRWLNAPQSTGAHALSLDAVAMFPNRERAVSITNINTGGDFSKGMISQLALWDLKTGMRIRTLELSTGEITAAAVFPDGKRIITTSKDKTPQIWDLKTGECVEGPKGHTDWITDIKIFSSGEFAISGSYDKTVRVWDLKTSLEAITLKGHNEAVTAVALFPDERRAISASEDKTLKIWDLEAKREIRTLTGHEDWVNAVAVFPDGHRVISASNDCTLKIWDLESGGVRSTLTGHHHRINAVAIFASGKLVVSVSSDHTLTVWDLERNQAIAHFTGEAAYKCCAAHVDGVHFIAGGDLGKVNILRLNGWRKEA
jgi:WD40 repeat protein/Cdc6-like AAA superfamily ATPase